MKHAAAILLPSVRTQLERAVIGPKAARKPDDANVAFDPQQSRPPYAEAPLADPSKDEPGIAMPELAKELIEAGDMRTVLDDVVKVVRFHSYAQHE